jgi:hypothetical protein
MHGLVGLLAHQAADRLYLDEGVRLIELAHGASAMKTRHTNRGLCRRSRLLPTGRYGASNRDRRSMTRRATKIP